jgi:TIR domain
MSLRAIWASRRTRKGRIVKTVAVERRAYTFRSSADVADFMFDGRLHQVRFSGPIDSGDRMDHTVSDIFISYASSDKWRIRPLVEALQEQGWSVWWDRRILPGEAWEEVVEKALVDTKCVIVLWSQKSIQSDWVRTEASDAKQRGILVPALLDEVTIPLAFRRIQAARLVDWSGTLPNAEFDKLVLAISQVLSQPASPASEARAVSVSPAKALFDDADALRGESGEVVMTHGEQAAVPALSKTANSGGPPAQASDDQRLVWLVLTPFLSIAAVLTVLLTGLLQQTYERRLAFATGFAWMLPLPGAFGVIAFNLRQIAVHQFRVGGASACILFSAYWLGAQRFEPNPVFVASILTASFVVVQWTGGFLVCYRMRHRGASGLAYLIGLPVLGAGITTLLVSAVWQLTGVWNAPDTEWLRIAFGPPLILFVCMCGLTLHVGLMGADFPDSARAWLGRLGISASIGMAVWIGVFVLAVFGPFWLAEVTLGWTRAGIALAVVWIANGIAWNVSRKRRQTRLSKLASRAAPIAFFVGLVLLISAGTHILLRELVGTEVPRSNCVTPITQPVSEWLLWIEPLQREYWCFLHYSRGLLTAAAALWGGCVFMSILLMRNLDKLWMHNLYDNVLVRGYLGTVRNPSTTDVA